MRETVEWFLSSVFFKKVISLSKFAYTFLYAIVVKKSLCHSAKSNHQFMPMLNAMKTLIGTAIPKQHHRGLFQHSATSEHWALAAALGALRGIALSVLSHRRTHMREKIRHRHKYHFIQ